MLDDLYCIILAAGNGTRMKSEIPKVLHKICGKPMISILVDTVKKTGIEKIIVVTGFKEELVKAELGNNVHYVTQKECLGTGHAVIQTKDFLKDKKGKVIVLCGDAPLIKQETLKKFINVNIDKKYDASVITMKVDNPFGYGRILKDNADNVLKIIEELDALSEEKLINEINSGMYCFNIEDLFLGLDNISCANRKKEYYLTDVIQILNKKDKKIKSFCLKDANEAIGINSRFELAIAEKFLKKQIIKKIIDEGVTILDPDLTYIEEDVIIGKDTIIEPFVKISRAAIIGENCKIQSFSDIKSGQIIGNGETIGDL